MSIKKRGIIPWRRVEGSMELEADSFEDMKKLLKMATESTFTVS